MVIISRISVKNIYSKARRLSSDKKLVRFDQLIIVGIVSSICGLTASLEFSELSIDRSFQEESEAFTRHLGGVLTKRREYQSA